MKRWVDLKTYDLISVHRDMSLLPDLLTSDIDFFRELGVQAQQDLNRNEPINTTETK